MLTPVAAAAGLDCTNLLPMILLVSLITLFASCCSPISNRRGVVAASVICSEEKVINKNFPIRLAAKSPERAMNREQGLDSMLVQSGDLLLEKHDSRSITLGATGFAGLETRFVIEIIRQPPFRLNGIPRRPQLEQFDGEKHSATLPTARREIFYPEEPISAQAGSSRGCLTGWLTGTNELLFQFGSPWNQKSQNHEAAPGLIKNSKSGITARRFKLDDGELNLVRIGL